jgi:hypothetical protein
VTDYATEIEALAELQQRRKDYIQTINGNTNRARAFVRRALGWNPNDDEAGREKVNASAAKIVAAAFAGKGCALPEVETDLEVIAQSIAPLQKMRDGIEKDMKKIAKRLPAWKWAENVRGLGELGFAVIVAECGDLSKYANPAKVWKRLGLAPVEKNGVTMAASNWRMKGGLSADDWTAIGYSPRRRAEVYACIGDPLFRQQTVISGPYRQAYDRRRARTAETHPDWSKGHSHGDALRVMTKELLRDLWAAWNGREARTLMTPIAELPSSAPFSGPVEAAPDQPST